MRTIEIHGSHIVVAHIESFGMTKEVVEGGELIPCLKIRMTSGQEIAVAGNHRERVYANLREAFGLME